MELNKVKDAKGRGYRQAQSFSYVKNDNQRLTVDSSLKKVYK